MKLIEWSSDLSVNVEKIDSQHLNLVNMINDLNEAMLNKTGPAEVEKIIQSLIEYTEYHFKTEEDLFEEYSYAESGTHIKEHKAFVEKVLGFQKDLKESKMGLSVFVMDFLSSWLKNHIKGTDKKYTEFFNSKGLV